MKIAYLTSAFVIILLVSCKSSETKNFDREQIDFTLVKSINLDAMHPSPKVYSQDTIWVSKGNDTIKR